MSTKHSKFYRLLSLLLVCTMLFELLPANALAVGEEVVVSPAVTPEAGRDKGTVLLSPSRRQKTGDGSMSLEKSKLPSGKNLQ